MAGTNPPRIPFNVGALWPYAYPPPVQTTATPTATQTRNIFYKTRMCRKYLEGRCLTGNGCIYAHGPDELRKPPPNWCEFVFNRELGKGLANLNDDKSIVRRMNICRDFYRGGACLKGENCGFLHEDPSRYKVQNIGLIKPTEMKESYVIALGSGTSTHPQWKSRLCKKWETKGSCPYGEQCQFAHGILELQHGVPMETEEDVMEPLMKRVKIQDVIDPMQTEQEEDEGWKWKA